MSIREGRFRPASSDVVRRGASHADLALLDGGAYRTRRSRTSTAPPSHDRVSYYDVRATGERPSDVSRSGPCAARSSFCSTIDLTAVRPGRDRRHLHRRRWARAPATGETTTHDRCGVPARPADEERLASTGPGPRARSTRGLDVFSGAKTRRSRAAGYRIELGEIEAALLAIGGLGRVVRRRRSPRTASRAPRSAAPTSPRDGPARLGRDHARASPPSCPAYMLPSRWLALEALPKNANGKIDRPRIRSLFEETQTRAEPSP